MAQNGRVQLPRPFLLVILFGGELLIVLRNASLASAPLWLRLFHSCAPVLAVRYRSYARLVSRVPLFRFYLALSDSACRYRDPRVNTGTGDQILRSQGFALGISVWSCRDLPRQSRLGGCWRPGSSKAMRRGLLLPLGAFRLLLLTVNPSIATLPGRA